LITELFFIALAWSAYGVLHSWLASASLKRRIANRWPGAARAYRLIFNVLAVLLVLPPLWLTWRYTGPLVIAWSPWLSWPTAAATVIGYLWSMRWYDGMDFMGLRQIRSGHAPEHFIISPMHRWVRHPWYSLGLLYLWTRDLNAGWLIAVIAITLYLIVGARLEEQKLIAAFGDAYKLYCKRVPSLIPWPGKRLSAQEAESLEALAARRSL
jgi:protein-S-isoprenylcysteine O-methyltransferase Ste14